LPTPEYRGGDAWRMVLPSPRHSSEVMSGTDWRLVVFLNIIEIFASKGIYISPWGLKVDPLGLEIT